MEQFLSSPKQTLLKPLTAVIFLSFQAFPFETPICSLLGNFGTFVFVLQRPMNHAIWTFLTSQGYSGCLFQWNRLLYRYLIYCCQSETLLIAKRCQSNLEKKLAEHTCHFKFKCHWKQLISRLYSCFFVEPKMLSRQSVTTIVKNS